MSEPATHPRPEDRWDHIVAAGKFSLRRWDLWTVLIVVAIVLAVSGDHWWTLPIRVVLVLAGVTYWIAVWVAVVRNFRAGYQGRD